MSLTPEELSEQHAGFWGYQMVARLRDGVTVSQAAQDADRVAKQIMSSVPAGMSAIHIRGDVMPLTEYAVAEVRPLLRTLFLTVSVVLLIACVNVAGLLLVRAIRRRREYALRLALGARSAVMIRESVLEGLLLSIPGGLLGLAFAATLIRTALHPLPDSMPRVNSIAMDGMVVASVLLLALATGILCSLAPAFAALRSNLIEGLEPLNNIPQMLPLISSTMPSSTALPASREWSQLELQTSCLHQARCGRPPTPSKVCPRIAGSCNLPALDHLWRLL